LCPLSVDGITHKLLKRNLMFNAILSSMAFKNDNSVADLLSKLKGKITSKLSENLINTM